MSSKGEPLLLDLTLVLPDLADDEVGVIHGVNTLIYTILKHFVSTPSSISSRISDLLNNLRCPTMSDYRLY